jgi:hypothetical protein
MREWQGDLSDHCSGHGVTTRRGINAASRHSSARDHMLGSVGDDSARCVGDRCGARSRFWLRVQPRRTQLHTDRLHGSGRRSDWCAGADSRDDGSNGVRWIDEKLHLHRRDGQLPGVLPRFHAPQHHYSAVDWHPDHRSDSRAALRTHAAEWCKVPSGVSKRSSDRRLVKSLD